MGPLRSSKWRVIGVLVRWSIQTLDRSLLFTLHLEQLRHIVSAAEHEAAVTAAFLFDVGSFFPIAGDNGRSELIIALLLFQPCARLQLKDS